MPINQRLLDAIKLGDEEGVKLYVRDKACSDDYDYYDTDCTDVNIQNDEYNNWSLLHYAIFYNKPNIVHLLLDLGADLEIKTGAGSTPLNLAVLYNRVKIIKILLSRGANLEAEAIKGIRPLHCAAANGTAEIVTILLDGGANLEAEAIRGIRPLHYAAANGTAEIAEVLLDRGADLEATTTQGRKPLHFAVFYNNVEVTKVLLRNNADVNAVNNHGDTPLNVARRKYSYDKNYKNITKLLEEVVSLDIAFKEYFNEEVAHNRTTISSVIEGMTISNTSNGIVDMRNSTIPSLITATTVVPQHLHQDRENTTNLLLSGGSVENGTFGQVSSLSSINGNGLLMFIGYICTYAYKKMFSTDGPSTVMNAPSLGQDHTLALQLN
ncbi:ankyrin repeat domain-containing protein [Candidatus Mesenet endosymbiont of Phosphuga atrata]|uniref:ankyrin repeat domain-containing protein n=1 Tax=Candidatus Mesenet endosymbiont of Phosphuga atrata TaxID=3066221 RepID=UPI0030D0F1FD